MMKKIAFCLCVVVFMLSLTGCGKKATYSGGLRKIEVNLVKQEMKTTSVRFYDFKHNKYTPIPNDTYTITSYKSVEVWFQDKNGNQYVAIVDKALNDFPDSFKLYINYSKTDWDTYKK